MLRPPLVDTTVRNSLGQGGHIQFPQKQEHCRSRSDQDRRKMSGTFVSKTAEQRHSLRTPRVDRKQSAVSCRSLGRYRTNVIKTTTL